jgi:O-antigen/teichoic acid export membrane protein
MWWRFGFDVLFVALLVGFAWVLVPKRGALGLAAAYGFAYACTSLAFFLFHRQRSWNSSRSQQSQRQPAAKVTGKLMSEL